MSVEFGGVPGGDDPLGMDAKPGVGPGAHAFDDLVVDLSALLQDTEDGLAKGELGGGEVEIEILVEPSRGVEDSE